MRIMTQDCVSVKEGSVKFAFIMWDNDVQYLCLSIIAEGPCGECCQLSQEKSGTQR